MEIFGVEVPVWVLLALICTASIYWYFTEKFDFFKKRGIPGPPPWPILGNLYDAMKIGLPVYQDKMIQKYGKIVGVFHGNEPSLLVADPEILKHILIKEFPNFMDRRRLPFKFEPPYCHMINTAEGHEWKRIRNLLSPAFSTGKLNLMVPQMNECADVLVENLSGAAKNGESVKVKDFVGSFTMDVIAATAFGMKLNTQKDKENEFLKHAKLFFSARKVTILMALVPALGKLLRNWFNVPGMDPKLTSFMKPFCERLIEERRKKDIGQLDFLQLMMNAHKEEPERESERDDGKVEGDDKSQNKGLSNEEIIGQTTLFFMAGYETTASTLSFLLYALATNPETQDRLAEEVDEILEDDENLTPEKLMQMSYLDKCIKETLRLYVQAYRLTRTADKPITINGIMIPAGIQIVAPVTYLHSDPDVWPNPDKFDPDRFTPEAKAGRHSMQYLPFGEGPRNCIGERMARLEMKVAMSKLIHRYRFEPCADTQIPMKFRKNTTRAEKPIQLRVVERSR